MLTFSPRYGTFQPENLHVITMISNPVRYQSRYRLWREFNERMTAAGVSLWTMELQLGMRPFEITDPINHSRHFQVRGRDELWAKENALNVLARHLPESWEYLAWIDADVEFVGKYAKSWPTEIIHALQVYDVIQPWETATDLGPDGQALATYKSFCSQYIKSGAMHPETSYHEWHPGFAWACTRDAFDAMGGFFEHGVAGAGDRHMALSFVNQAHLSYHPEAPEAYKRSILEWQKRQLPKIRKDIGYMPGHLIHYFHGKKKDRRYWDRWQIINETNFNPQLDLAHNYQGILELSHRGIESEDFDKSVRLRDLLRAYFRQRHEDSIDLE